MTPRTPRPKKRTPSSRRLNAPSRARRPKSDAQKPAKPKARKRRARPAAAEASASSSSPAPPAAATVIGRPTRYSLELAERLVEAIAAGVPAATACRIEGIAKRTYHSWRQWGRQGRAPFDLFEEDITRALAIAEGHITRLIASATLVDWKAGAWWLERRFPKRYGPKQQVRVEKAPGDMTDEELEQAVVALGYVRMTPELAAAIEAARSSPDAKPPTN